MHQNGTKNLMYLSYNFKTKQKIRWRSFRSIKDQINFAIFLCLKTERKSNGNMSRPK